MSAVVVMLAELFSGRALRPVSLAGKREEPAMAEEAGVARAEERVSPVAATAQAASADRRLPASLLSVQADATFADEMDEDVKPEEDAGTQPSDGNEFSIETVAAYLTDSRARIAFAISPSGDDGSTATVMLARELDERGRKVVLIDMTGSACPTWLMAARRDLPGITDLLCGAAPFSETIHPDRLSGADVIPQGNSDVRQAMRGADRLSMIADALADAYDLVLVECGPANAESVARLSRNGDHEIILSAPAPDEQELVEIMAAFEKVGYSDLVLMSGTSTHGYAAKRSAA